MLLRPKLMFLEFGIIKLRRRNISYDTGLCKPLRLVEPRGNGDTYSGLPPVCCDKPGIEANLVKMRK